MFARVRVRLLALLASTVLAVTIVPVSGLQASNDALGGNDGRWSFNAGEKCLMRKINKIRAQNGRARLKWDKQIGVVARRHAKAMARNYSVFHDYNMQNEITRWRKLAQNSGAGGNCRKVFWSFMRSSGHRANILGTWRHLGVGVDWRNGRVFAQQVFEWRRDPGNVYSYP